MHLRRVGREKRQITLYVGLSRSLILSEGATPVLEGQVLQLASTVGVPRAFQAGFRIRIRTLMDPH
jgi:hypothetical protein